MFENRRLVVCLFASLLLSRLGGAEAAPIVYQQSLPSAANWTTGFCSPCDIIGNWRAFASFTLAEDTVLRSADFAVLDISVLGRQDIGVSIWTTPFGTKLFDSSFLQEDYTRAGSQSRHTASVNLADWTLGAGTYWISLVGVGGNTTGWGSDGRVGDDSHFRPNGSLATGGAYMGFTLYGDAPGDPDPVPVPAPATLGLLLAGLLAVGSFGRRRPA